MKVGYTRYTLTAVSVFSGEGPPVPIPNTVVKITCADNTWLATARKDRAMLTHLKRCKVVFYHHLLLYAQIKRFDLFLLSSVGRAHDC